MKKLLLVLALLALATGCKRIGPGYVGIKVNMAGTGRGVQDTPAVTGFVTYNPFSSSILEYPTYVQTAIWTRNAKEGKDSNEEISFNTSEGSPMTADISLSYQLVAAKVPHFYVKFKTDDLDKFTHGYLRNVARDAIGELASTYTVEQIYGVKKAEFLSKARAAIQAQVSEVGVEIQQFGFVEAPRPPDNILAAINAKNGAIQTAIQAQNKVVEAKALADQQIERARGEAQSQFLKSKAEAEGNKLLAESVTSGLIQIRALQVQQEMIQKWDGRRPQIEGGASGSNFLFQVPAVAR